MGRPRSPWLERAYEICSDGRWHHREDVLRDMVRLVPPAVAYRRGVSMTPLAEVLTERELIRRGARHVCIASLRDASELVARTQHGEILIRKDLQDRPAPPMVFERADEDDATHVLVPIEVFNEIAEAGDDVEFVRSVR